MASHNTDVDARPFRTSDDEETSRRSRARVSRACTRCRTRKDKCDGQQPECSNCANAGQPCLYVAATKKRGLPEGYVRGLEKLWAVMLQKVDGLDNAVRRVVDEHDEELLRIWNHHRHGDDLHTAWKESTVLADLERLLSRIDHAPLDLKRKRDRDDSDPAPNLSDSPANTNALSPDFRVTDISADDQSVVTPQVGAAEQWFGRLPQTRFGASTLERPSFPPQPSINLNFAGAPAPPQVSSDGTSESLGLPSSASDLLDQYFTYTHCWFPILDRPYMLRKFYQHSRSQNPGQADSGDLACLWAICAYSHQQTRRLGMLPQQSHSDAVSKMRTIARGLIPSESGPFMIGHVQALLLLVLLDIGLGDWTSAWMSVGFAVRALLDAMADEASKSLSSSSVVVGSRNGTSWGQRAKGSNKQRWRAVFQGCFILDTILSLRMRRPPHLRSYHLEADALQPLDEDGHEEWEPWGVNGRDTDPLRQPAFVISCFNRLTELFMIANDAAESGRQQGNLPNNNDISRWFSLSERYPFKVSDITRRPPHQMFLQACHFSVAAILSQTNIQLQQGAMLQLCTTVDLLGQSFNSPDRCGIPSLLAAVGQLCFHSANAEQSWSHNVGAPHERYNKLAPNLAATWPGFQIVQTTASIVPAEVPDVSSHGSGPRTQNTFPISPRSTNFQRASNGPGFETFAGPTEIPATFAAPDNSTYQNPTEEPQQHAPSDYQPMSIDLSSQDGQSGFAPESSGRKGTVAGLATSPSFNGDEIDALFHEMAQLDTTQWSMGRSQGLKDFGFADDSTFEAFCNDPDRLMLSDGYMGPAFNSGGGVPPAQGSVVNHQGDAQFGKMSFEDIFR